MKKHYLLIATLLFSATVPLLTACNESEPEAEKEAAKTVAVIDACSLLTQVEVDSLFGKSAGPGRPDTSVPNVPGCVWPADGIPDFIVQVLPAPADVKANLTAGDGYKMLDVEGLSGQAAVAIQQANPQYGLKEGVAIFGIAKRDYMVTLSPVRLNIQEGSPQFEVLKQVADAAAGRL